MKKKMKKKLRCKKSDESQGIQTEKPWQCSSIKSTTHRLQQRALHRAERRSTSKGAARERGAREGGVDDDPRSQSRSYSVSLLEDLDLKAKNFADLICSENTHTQPTLHGLVLVSFSSF